MTNMRSEGYERRLVNRLRETEKHSVMEVETKCKRETFYTDRNYRRIMVSSTGEWHLAYRSPQLGL